MKKIVNLVFVLLFTLGYGDPPKVPDQKQIKQKLKQAEKELIKVNKEIKRNDSLKNSEDSRFNSLKSNYNKDLSNRKKEITEMESKINSLSKKIRIQRNKKRKFENRIQEEKVKSKELVKALIQECKKLEKSISTSIPWNLDERMQRVAVLRRDLENGNASHEEGFTRLNGLYKDEIKNGDEISIVNKPLTRSNGETVNAQVLKIGYQWIVYMDEEERHYGILQRSLINGDPNYSWKEELDFSERKWIREAIEVKLAKKPPRLVQLPLTLSLSPNKEGQ